MKNLEKLQKRLERIWTRYHECNLNKITCEMTLESLEEQLDSVEKEIYDLDISLVKYDTRMEDLQQQILLEKAKNLLK